MSKGHIWNNFKRRWRRLGFGQGSWGDWYSQVHTDMSATKRQFESVLTELGTTQSQLVLNKNKERITFKKSCNNKNVGLAQSVLVR